MTRVDAVSSGSGFAAKNAKTAATLAELVKRIRDKLVATRDTVCLQRAELVTEAWEKHEAQPPPLRRALAFAHLLGHMDLDLRSNPIFAGNTASRPRAWMLIPEHGFATDAQVVLENPSLKHILEGAIPRRLREYWQGRSFGGSCGIGHLAVDLEAVVHRGLEALIEEACRYARRGSEQQRVYRYAMRVALEAVIHWSQRYAQAAEAAAKAETDPLLCNAYAQVAKACKWVPARPARNLFEGFQAIALTQIAIAVEGHGMSVSIGLPDRVLAPFVDDSFDAEEATNLAAAFMLKISANSVFGSGSKTQAITVGGADHQGQDQSNALTLCFLEAANRLRIGDPHPFLRWHPNLDPRVKQRAMEMLSAGVSMPLLINDTTTAAGLMNAGVRPEDAWEYCVIGCNELGIPGRLMESAITIGGTVQYLELLNEVLLPHPDPDSIANMDQLLAALETRMLQRALQMRENGELHCRRMAEQVPTPFTSALMRGCIQRGEDLLSGMTYRLPGVYERGLTNAANALAAIDEVVFRKQAVTLAELVRALREDLPDGRLREQLLAAPKWGNDDDRADRWALELVTMRERVFTQVDTRFGGRPHMSCHVVRSLHHLDGKRIAASADGRRAWTAVADSIGAQTGTARAGPTAVLNSVLKLDASKNYCGGYNLNITLSPKTARTDVLLPLVETFFQAGGQELQVNVFDAATLRAAQRNPERYGDLVVRVAGLSARFVDLSAVEQEELIARAEATGGV